MSQLFQNQTTEKNSNQKKTNLLADTELAKDIIPPVLIRNFTRNFNEVVKASSYIQHQQVARQVVIHIVLYRSIIFVLPA